MSDTQNRELAGDDLEKVKRLKEAYDALKQELSKVIVGQDEVVDELFISLFSRGHALLIGVPGLAKTLMISSLAKVLNLSFNRIQFTPDLMPSDITGTEVIQEDKASGTRVFKFLKGPIFANIILADEINRTPPKTQAAMLESMQERQVTVGGERYTLDQPFFVLATQNPIEQEGTYPLPEAQLDRFMFMIKVDYPSLEEEREILRRTTEGQDVELSPVLSSQEILDLQDIVRRVPIADQVLDYAMRLARFTRLNNPNAPAFIKEQLAWGAGPRASQYLVIAAKAKAILAGRFYVSADDVKAVAHPVLRHRIICNFSAEAEGITPDMVVDRLLETVDPNESAALSDGKLPGVLN
ncbi:MAG: AAA family ATPase [Planctomycetota bacterium]|nr:MAG: AAA family ATPase [Planctomycetota bacterium]